MPEETRPKLDWDAIKDDPVLYEMLTNAVSDGALEKLDKRTARIRNLSFGVFAVGGLIIAYLFQIVMSQGEVRISEMATRVDNRLQELSSGQDARLQHTMAEVTTRLQHSAQQTTDRLEGMVDRVDRRLAQAVDDMSEGVEIRATSLVAEVQSETRRIVAKESEELVRRMVAAAINDVEEQAIANIRSSAEESLALAEAQWNRISAFSELSSLVDKIESVQAFSENQAVRLRELLGLVHAYSGDDPATDMAQFAAVLERVIDIFQGADRDDLVREMETVFGSDMRSVPGVVQTMLQAIGNSLIGAAVPPTVSETGKRAEIWTRDYERFLEYANLSLDTIAPYTAVYVPLVNFVAGNPQLEVRDDLEELANLNERELEGAEKLLVALATGGWVMTATEESRRAMTRTLEYLGKFKAYDQTGLLAEVNAMVGTES